MNMSSLSCLSYSIRSKDCSFRNHAVLFLSDLQAKIALISVRAFEFLAACWQAVQQIYFKLIKRSQETDALLSNPVSSTHAIELQYIHPKNTEYSFEYNCSLEESEALREELRKQQEAGIHSTTTNISPFCNKIPIKVQAPSNAKIRVLKESIAKEIRKPFERIVLRFGGTELQDDQHWDYYKLEPCHKVQVFIKR